MAEPVKTKISHDILDAKTGDTVVTIYSTTGKPRTKEDFAQAYKAWEEGREGGIKEFAFLEPGFMETARRGFEAVNQPIQQGLQAIGKTIGGDIAPSGYAALAERLGIAKPGTAQSIQQTGENIGQAVGQAVGSTVATPQDAGGTVGTIGALMATRGLSLPLQLGRMLPTFAGNMLGRVAGSATTGTGPKLEDAIVNSLISAGVQGGIGAFKSILGYSVSRQAQDKVAARIMDLTKGELKDVMADPKALERFSSTPGGMAMLLREGYNAVRGDLRNVADDLIVAVNKRSPNSLSRKAANQLRELSDDFVEASNQYLDAAADRVNQRPVLAKLNAIMAKMDDTVMNEFASASPQTKQAILKELGQAIQNVHEYNKKFTGAAELFGALRRSSQDGFTAQKFQQETAQYFNQNPQSLVEAARKLAFRGADPVRGMDTSFRAQKRIPHTPFTLSIPGASGQRYAGSVQSPLEPITEGLAGESAIRSFFGGKKE